MMSATFLEEESEPETTDITVCVRSDLYRDLKDFLKEHQCTGTPITLGRAIENALDLYLIMHSACKGRRNGDEGGEMLVRGSKNGMALRIINPADAGRVESVLVRK